MKTIKYIILGIFITTMTLGNFTSILGQGSIQFSETYTYAEIASRLNPSDQFFSYFNTEQTDPKSSNLGYCLISESSSARKYLKSDLFLSRLPEDIIFAWGAKKENGSTSDLYALRKPSGRNISPDNSDIASVSVQSDEQQNNHDLLISFTREGAAKWASLTGKNKGRNIAIVIDGKVYAAPTVREEILGGKCAISGNFSKEEVLKLKSQLEN